VIVEQAPRDVLFRDPRHPYTQALLAAVPSPDLDQPLDFTRVVAGGFSEPTRWPEPYRLAPGTMPTIEEVAPRHFLALGSAATPLGTAAAPLRAAS